MKYEIIKGSDKDFEGAPEWATLLTTIGGQRFFVEKHAGSARLIDINNREESTINANPMPHQFDGIEVIAERRPIAEPVWSGEGLPPVGVECEILWNDDWVKCVVKAYGEEQLIFKAEGSREWAGHIKNYKFRPICSSEDVARDEAIESMAEIIEYRTGCSPKPLARWLYEAGYRKME